MIEKCIGCKKSLEIGDGSYYYCHCKENKVYCCPACYIKQDSCPECGSKLQYHEESITKKAYFNPATRGGLGF